MRANVRTTAIRATSRSPRTMSLRRLMPLLLLPRPPRNHSQVRYRPPFARFFHEFTDQADGFELRIDDVQARRMAEEIEHGLVLDGPFHAEPDGFEEPLQLPAAAAKGADVADRTHGDF